MKVKNNMSKLQRILPKKSGRSFGTITTRHQGGRQKRFLRVIDFKRDKIDIWGKVEEIQYDPNRTANVAQVCYEDGERRYILAPLGLTVGQKVISSANAPFKPGNCLPLSKIIVGTQVHNLEIRPGKGGQIVRGAGSAAIVHGKEELYVLVKLPSGEIRRFVPDAKATVGQVGIVKPRSARIGKAGTKRKMGIRPTVRGVAQNPHSHPHGGGEGRSGIGMKFPKTYKGRKAVGKTRQKRKYSNRLIIKPRKKGSHS
ncbi:50S ribosomal protein L2 [Candidatus Woesebacteria bacterium]|nr:MAG: 50S ribosomal protein L2 [Candidatus Woesebacteria bacterium]